MINRLKYAGGLFIAVLIVIAVKVIVKQYFDKTPSSNSNTISNLVNSEKPWITWVYSGIKMSTPEKLKENAYNMTEYEKSVVSKIGSYSFESNEINIMVHYLKYLRNEVGYDFESGLKGAISNGVNGLGGTNLTFSITDTSEGNKKIASGTFQMQAKIMEYKEIIYFNGKNEVGGVIIFGSHSDNTNQIILKIINSIEYLF